MGDNSCKRDIGQAQQHVASSQPESPLAYTCRKHLRINFSGLGAGNFVRWRIRSSSHMQLDVSSGGQEHTTT